MGTATQTAFDEVMKGLDQAADAAEEIYWKLSPGQLPNSEQRRIPKAVGVATRHDLDREIGPVSNVKRWLEQAGTRAEHDEASMAAVNAVREEKERLPALEEQFKVIESQIKQLQNTRAQAVTRLGDLNRAREALREPRVLPVHIREKWEADVHCAEQPYAARINELEHELAVTDAIANMDLTTVAGQRSAELHAESSAPQLIRREETVTAVRKNPDGTVLDSRGVVKKTFDTDGFNRYREKRLKERPKLQRELNELQELRDGAIAKVARLLDHYVDRIV